MKMYIAVLDQVPSRMVPVLVAHTVLGCDIDTSDETFWWADYEKLYMSWRLNSFKKCVVKVNQKEFNKIALLDNVYLGHENTTLGGAKSCAALVVDDEIPNVLKFAKLWNV